MLAHREQASIALAQPILGFDLVEVIHVRTTFY
jgi:hypothetical protein